MSGGGVPKWTYRARLEIGLSGDEPGTWVRIPPPPPHLIANRTLIHPPLPVVDEIGCLPVTQSGTVLFFQLIDGRLRSGLNNPDLE